MLGRFRPAVKAYAAAATDDDRALLAAWRAGDRERGNQLFQRHIRAVPRFFRRCGGVITAPTAGSTQGSGAARSPTHAPRRRCTAITDDTIVLVPVKRVGLLRRFAPRHGPRIEVLCRAHVIVEIGATERAFGAQITPVRFVRRDGSARLVDFRADPSPWQALAR